MQISSHNYFRQFNGPHTLTGHSVALNDHEHCANPTYLLAQTAQASYYRPVCCTTQQAILVQCKQAQQGRMVRDGSQGEMFVFLPTLDYDGTLPPSRGIAQPVPNSVWTPPRYHCLLPSVYGNEFSSHLRGAPKLTVDIYQLLIVLHRISNILSWWKSEFN